MPPRLRAATLSFVLLVGCGTGQVTTSPRVQSNDGSPLFVAVVQSQLEEASREPVDVEVRVMLADVMGGGSAWPPVLATVLAELPTSVRSARQKVLDSLQVRVDTTLAWGGCPSFKSMEADWSPCPTSSRAVLAVGLADSALLGPPDAAVLGRPLAKDEAVVRTAATFLSPGGAHTRFTNLLVSREPKGWAVLQRLGVSYIE